jgi:hypothetical protein
VSVRIYDTEHNDSAVFAIPKCAYLQFPCFQLPEYCSTNSDVVLTVLG